MISTEQQGKLRIAEVLSGFSSGSFADKSLALLGALGYRSEKRIDLSPNTLQGFVAEFDREGKLNLTKALTDQWESVDLLFQLTGEEVSQSSQMRFVFETGKRVDNHIIESYLFFAIGLRGERYTRGQLAGITREINKLFPMPAMVLFRHGQTITLSIINRRLHTRDESKDVLEKITLIKDISFANPHRAHVEILYDLSLTRLFEHYAFANFVDLHRAWQKTLDSSELNKRFYREVANWYFWAKQHVVFPKDAGKDEETRNATSVIRLITRLIFVWFLKEKGLVPDALFNKRKLDEILNWADPKNSTYYKAILQNLFFATLNQEMNTPGRRDKRTFRHLGQRYSDDYNVTGLYRYERYFEEPNAALRLFESVPFLNGGLFECLDKTVATDGQEVARREKVRRVDGFSDRSDNELIVPDFLFFSDEREVDLNDVFFTLNKRYRVSGLVRILEKYKFTVEENTPIEEEIALDPELLGRVFENLLAAYNPETGVTARKQTGSFYTPREIVNYMVDEALIAYLESKLLDGPSGVDDTARQDLNERLRHLLAYKEEPPRFDEGQQARLIEAIDQVKVLDPACGSGAFPMGVLHKLVFILGKLDPGNRHWKDKQIAKVTEIPDITMRERFLDEIEQAFGENEFDYGRKLYLIQNCIYGVDIQPIAVQIAKLRFFISLVVDQRADDVRVNRGIIPLPNLETKFVAADTLLSAEKQTRQMLPGQDVLDKRHQLAEVRKKHFTARRHRDKEAYRDQDRQLRAEISGLLKRDGLLWETAERLAHWDPYDQNAVANFFDPEWMFGVTDGFDIVIGNPPYGLLNKRQNKAEAIVVAPQTLDYFKTTPEYALTASGMINIYRLFILKSIALLRERGIFCEIFPLAFVGDISAAPLRRHILNDHTTVFIEAFPERDNEQKRVFEAAKMSVCILQVKKVKGNNPLFFIRVHRDRHVDTTTPKTHLNAKLISLLDRSNNTIPLMSQQELDLAVKVCAQSRPFAEIGHCFTGEIDLTLCSKYLTDSPLDAVLLKGAIIDRYRIRKEMSQGEIKFLDSARYLTEIGGKKTVHFRSERIVMQGITGVNERVRLKMTLVGSGIFCANSVNYLAFHKNDQNTKFVLGLLNSRLLNFLFSRFSTNSNVNGYEIDNLPFPSIVGHEVQQAIEARVDEILKLKRTKPGADVSALEAEIDQMVHRVYGLTPEEIKIVEES